MRFFTSFPEVDLRCNNKKAAVKIFSLNVEILQRYKKSNLKMVWK